MTDPDQLPLILAVDDTEANLDILVDLLGENYNVSVAIDGTSALELVEEEIPDLVLLDIMMPEMDGYEVCRKLKEKSETAQIPVIFLTAKSEPEDIARGFDTGAVDYVPKPFNAVELLARVKTQLEIKHNRDLVIQKSTEQKELLHILCHDLANPFNSMLGVMEVVSDDPETFEEYADLLRKSVSNGLEVIELVRGMRAVEEKPLELSDVNLSEGLDNSLSILGSRFDEKSIAANVDVAADIVVRAERTSLINSVLNNVLTNAVKFSQEGTSIDITAKAENAFVTFSIADHGVGMPATLVDDLFDVSKATSRPGTNGEKGTGFGMPLIRKFMEAYGGTITVESKDIGNSPEDHGTTVILTFLPVHLKA
ncbi:MAG: hybrid sensor histidine kinase/response regulator [Spirochaetales bacterium]|jgi:two-component system, sensor histidine kinase and response regulator|nr:hybrid sensor histidine kinase/response regulator [Spirochaetales bacterium]